MRVDAVIAAPIDSSGRFAGCELMPAALRAAGISDWPIVDHGNIQAVLADPVREQETGILAFRDFVSASTTISQDLSALLKTGSIPLVLGGCCSLLVGVLAGASRVHPDIGLVFIDGHFDLHTPSTSVTGEAADMEMSFILGEGPPELTGLTGAERIIDPARVVFVGARDHDEMLASGAELPAIAYPDALVIDEADLLSGGLDRAAADSLSHLAESGGNGHWVHIDLDVLSPQVFPAVDYLHEGGLDWPQLAKIVRPLVEDPGFRGLSVAILNPRLDPDGTSTARTEAFLKDLLS